MPADVGESFDWAVRTDPSWPNISKSADKRRLFDALLEQRATLLHFEHRIPKEFGFDMAYVRWPGEVEYVYRLHALLSSGALDKYTGVHADLLVYQGVLVSPDRRDLAYLCAEARQDPSLGVSVITGMTTLAFREFERQMRHRTGMLIPGHCREGRVLRSGVLPSMFAALPGWWLTVEICWSMRAELPRCLAYLSRLLLGDARHPAWNIFRTEWAVEVCRDLLYQARDRRLFWIPPAVRQDIQTIGLEKAFLVSGEQVVSDLGVLLDYIDCLRWSRCPPENRYSLPDQTKITPVFISGDYFEFDPVEWRVLVEDDMFIRRDEQGNLLEPMDDHGERFVGITAGRFVSETNRSGFSRGPSANYSGARGRWAGKRGMGKTRGKTRARGTPRLSVRALPQRETRELIPRCEDEDDDVVMSEASAPTGQAAGSGSSGGVGTVAAAGSSVTTNVVDSSAGKATVPPGFYQNQIVGQLRQLFSRVAVQNTQRSGVSVGATGLRSVPLQSPRRPSLSVKEGVGTPAQSHASGSSVQNTGEREKSAATEVVSSTACETIDLTGSSTDDEPIYGSRPPPNVTIEVKKEVAMEMTGGTTETRAPDGDCLTEDREEYKEESE